VRGFRLCLRGLCSIIAFDATGKKLGTYQKVLQPGEHFAGNAGPLLNINFSGSVQILATSPVVAVLLNAEAYPVFSSLPPADLPSGTPLAGAID